MTEGMTGREPGSPEGMSAREVDQRSDLARWVSGVHAFPADRAALLERARSQSAPEGVLSALRSLPDRTFDNLEDIAQELGIGGHGQHD
ncbi:DUF2795 domain-containing protein [Nonomuraea sp. NPDC050783]|uniref:DUF2795 domain-containing protein n=1 Tax=Nonomuraea sp. NPDC050783 TaxID=3154634 RepID=UPI0034658172